MVVFTSFYSTGKIEQVLPTAADETPEVQVLTLVATVGKCSRPAHVVSFASSLPRSRAASGRSLGSLSDWPHGRVGLAVGFTVGRRRGAGTRVEGRTVGAGDAT